jgi:hypothetical protein
MRIRDVIEHDEQSRRSGRTPLEYVLERRVIKRRGERDDALMRFIRKLREKTAAFESHGDRRISRRRKQLAQGRIATAHVRDVNAQELLAAGKRFGDGVNAVDDPVEIEDVAAI